jgi:hypothetical protein
MIPHQRMLSKQHLCASFIQPLTASEASLITVHKACQFRLEGVTRIKFPGFPIELTLRVCLQAYLICQKGENLPGF